MKKLRRLIKFCIVGSLCFIVDLTCIYIFVYLFDFPKTLARYPSWLISVTTSYFLNLAFTFKSKSRIKNKINKHYKIYIFYISTQALGGILNIYIYTISLIKFNLSIGISLILGTLSGLVVNYLGASKVIKKYYS